MKYGIFDTAKYLNQMFDIIRIVNPLLSEVVEFKDNVKVKGYSCYDFWNTKGVCTNCIAIRAYNENQTMVKIEYSHDKLYWVMAEPIEEDGKRYVIETLKDITTSGIVENLQNKTVRLLNEEIEQMNRLLVTDELTGCFNRRYIEGRLRIDIAKSIKRQDTLTVVMLDIDGFKKINDTYGHLVGDRALKDMVQIVKAKLGTTVDWVARLGGEEFVIVFHDKSIEEAIKIVEEIRCEIAEHEFWYEEKFIQFTISGGIAALSEQNDEKDKLLKEADKNLYKAKLAGKNRIYY